MTTNTIGVNLTLLQLDYINTLIARDIATRTAKLATADPDRKASMIDRNSKAWRVMEEIRGAIGCFEIESHPAVFSLKTGHKVEITNYAANEIHLRFVRKDGQRSYSQTFPRHEVEALLNEGQTLPI